MLCPRNDIDMVVEMYILLTYEVFYIEKLRDMIHVPLGGSSTLNNLGSQNITITYRLYLLYKTDKTNKGKARSLRWSVQGCYYPSPTPSKALIHPRQKIVSFFAHFTRKMSDTA